LDFDEKAKGTLSSEEISRLWRVEPEYIEFLRELSITEEFRMMYDGDLLFKKFDEAGYGDVFYGPTESEWQQMRSNKLPDFDTELPKKIALDTLYSLLADADFEKHQEKIDEKIRESLPK
jgi:transaldolase